MLNFWHICYVLITKFDIVMMFFDQEIMTNNTIKSSGMSGMLVAHLNILISNLTRS